jgi:twitching motility two-component system response regulator PilH
LKGDLVHSATARVVIYYFIILEKENQTRNKRKNMAGIMVIDDDVELLEEMKEVLSFHKYEVDVIANSSVAFDEVCKRKPDLIILDMKMKPKGGFQLADEFHRSPVTTRIPIIACTGFYTEVEHLLMMKMFGMKHVILKPVNPIDLLAKIEELLPATSL